MILSALLLYKCYIFIFYLYFIYFNCLNEGGGYPAYEQPPPSFRQQGSQQGSFNGSSGGGNGYGGPPSSGGYGGPTNFGGNFFDLNELYIIIDNTW